MLEFFAAYQSLTLSQIFASKFNGKAEVTELHVADILVRLPQEIIVGCWKQCSLGLFCRSGSYIFLSFLESNVGFQDEIAQKTLKTSTVAKIAIEALRTGAGEEKNSWKFQQIQRSVELYDQWLTLR